MPEYLSPGVYVEEVSFRSKSIEGVPTSTTGFAGLTRFGPRAYAGGPLDHRAAPDHQLHRVRAVYGGPRAAAARPTPRDRESPTWRTPRARSSPTAASGSTSRGCSCPDAANDSGAAALRRAVPSRAAAFGTRHLARPLAGGARQRPRGDPVLRSKNLRSTSSPCTPATIRAAPGASRRRGSEAGRRGRGHPHRHAASRSGNAPLDHRPSWPWSRSTPDGPPDLPAATAPPCPSTPATRIAAGRAAGAGARSGRTASTCTTSWPPTPARSATSARSCRQDDPEDENAVVWLDWDPARRRREPGPAELPARPARRRCRPTPARGWPAATTGDARRRRCRDDLEGRRPTRTTSAIKATGPRGAGRDRRHRHRRAARTAATLDDAGSSAPRPRERLIGHAEATALPHRRRRRARGTAR